MREKMREKKKYRVTWEVTIEVEAENPYNATLLANKKWKNSEDDLLHICIEEIK